jgi:hypothetical protein
MFLMGRLTSGMLPSDPDLSPTAAEEGRADAAAPRCTWQEKKDKQKAI